VRDATFATLVGPILAAAEVVVSDREGSDGVLLVDKCACRLASSANLSHSSIKADMYCLGRVYITGAQTSFGAHCADIQCLHVSISVRTRLWIPYTYVFNKSTCPDLVDALVLCCSWLQVRYHDEQVLSNLACLNRRIHAAMAVLAAPRYVMPEQLQDAVAAAKVLFGSPAPSQVSKKLTVRSASQSEQSSSDVELLPGDWCANAHLGTQTMRHSTQCA
jgi:hypothetical protein